MAGYGRLWQVMAGYGRLWQVSSVTCQLLGIGLIQSTRVVFFFALLVKKEVGAAGPRNRVKSSHSKNPA